MGRLSDVLRQVLGKPVKTQELSLSGLTMPVVTHERVQAAVDASNKLVAECKEKYGDDWRRHFYEAMGVVGLDDFDFDLEVINHAIYTGGRPNTTSDDGSYRQALWSRLKERERELYGDFYDELIHHDYADPRVVELLLQDAVATGRWRELPGELHEAYLTRVKVGGI